MDYDDRTFRRRIIEALQSRNVDLFLATIQHWRNPSGYVYPGHSEKHLDILVDVLSENIDAFKELVRASNEWVNKVTMNGVTALYAASENGHVDVCKILITEGKADVNKALEV
ncbi:uncharacterized protein [Amphiura filiformis]|uniref:uncharacterized protein n=1 Tax=Amphiura filiformis TaxID=82378 RepID=UPI003B224E84